MVVVGVQNSSCMPLTVRVTHSPFKFLWLQCGFASIYCAQGKLQVDMGQQSVRNLTCSNQRMDNHDDQLLTRIAEFYEQPITLSLHFSLSSFSELSFCLCPIKK